MATTTPELTLTIYEERFKDMPGLVDNLERALVGAKIEELKLAIANGDQKAILRADIWLSNWLEGKDAL